MFRSNLFAAFVRWRYPHRVAPKECENEVPSVGLRKLCYHYGYPIRKDRKVCMGDWSAPTLADDQKQCLLDDNDL